MDNQNVITNTATVTYSYIVDSVLPPVINQISSTTTNTVQPSNIEVIKAVNIAQAYMGQCFCYTIYIKNIGTSPQNITLIDQLPPCLNLTFIKVNGECFYDLRSLGTGIVLGTLQPQCTITVVIGVCVSSVSCVTQTICNTATVLAGSLSQTVPYEYESNEVCIDLIGELPPWNVPMTSCIRTCLPRCSTLLSVNANICKASICRINSCTIQIKGIMHFVLMYNTPCCNCICKEFYMPVCQYITIPENYPVNYMTSITIGNVTVPQFYWNMNCLVVNTCIQLLYS